MDKDSINERNENCRRELLRRLNATPLLRFKIADAATAMNRDGRRLGETSDWTETEVSEASLFLAGMSPPLISRERLGIGSVVYLQITPAGTLFDEQND